MSDGEITPLHVTERHPIVFVSMPIAAVERPSLALGLLKSLLNNAGLPAKTIYPNIWFLEYIGLTDYHLLESSLPEEALIDWLFAPVAFPNFETSTDDFLDGFFARNPVYQFQRPKLTVTWLALRARMGEFIDWVVDQIIAMRPSIVGCTSTFNQHVPSLALLRRLRARAPEIITLMGGANCETVMGRTTHTHFTWVDYVVSGEADMLVAELCRDLLARGRDIPLDSLPFGVFGPAHRNAGYPATNDGDKVPRAVTENMQSLPLPDFDDYFAELHNSLYGARIYPGLPMEFSRGCWWGAKSHCTFCGLNGGAMNYRQKPAEQAAAEMTELSARYNNRNIEAVDNILAIDYVDRTLPQLTALPDKLNIFFEVKANLKRHEIEKFAAAGIRWIQPGIESLDTRVLKLMGKGTTAAQNVLLLKWCRQYGVRISWSVLWGFPGEKDHWYAELPPWLDALHHLQPGRAVRLRYQRYSPYHQTPDRFGLQLTPVPPYQYVYPLSAADLADQVYYFEDSPLTDAGGHIAARDTAQRPGLHAVAKALDAWGKSWHRAQLPMLTMRDDGDFLIVNDSRSIQPAIQRQFAGLTRDVLLAADDGAPETRIRERLTTAGHSADAITSAIAELVAARVILQLDGRLVGLPLWFPHTPMLAPDAFPGGYFQRRISPETAAA